MPWKCKHTVAFTFCIECHIYNMAVCLLLSAILEICKVCDFKIAENIIKFTVLTAINVFLKDYCKKVKDI